MAGGYDGSIRIDTRIDSKGFDAGINRMTNSIKNLAGMVGVTLGIAGLAAFGKSAVQTAMQIENAFSGLESIITGQGRSWEAAKQFVQDYTADGLVPLMNATTAYKNLAARGYSDEQIQKVMTALKNSAAFGRQASLSLGEAVQGATEGLKNENSVLVDNAGVTKNVSVMWKEYAASIGTTVDSLTKEQKIQAEVAGVMQETRFQMGDAGKLANSFSGQVSALGVSWMNLKASVGNAIMPILAQIIPYIKAVIDWFVVLFNTVARVIALFFNVDVSMGSAASSAGEIASSAGGMADDTQQAADAAGDLAGNTKKAEKAARGALAAFDELNVLQTDSGGGGSGGGGRAAPPAGGAPIGNIGIGDPKEIIPDALMKRVEAFKKALLEFFAPLKAPFERLKKAIMDLGGTIWDGLKWVWENILVPLGTWLVQEATPVFMDLLTAAINLLNDALEALAPLGDWLFENFLKPAAEWTGQAILDALKWLTDKLNDLSRWIRENPAAFQTIVVIIGLLAVAIWLTVAATTAWTVISGIATVATTAFGAAVAFLTSPIFLVILAIVAIIAIIVLLIEYWPQISEAAKLAWEWIVQQWSVAAEWFDENVIKPISKWFSQAWENIKKWASDAWTNIKSTWSVVSTWFQLNVIDPVKNWFDQALKDVQSFFQNTWNRVVDIWQGASDWITKKVTDPIKESFKTALDWVKEKWETIFNGLKDFMKGLINGIIGLLNRLLVGIADGLNGIINILNAFRVSIPSWVPKFGGQTFGFSLNKITAPQIPYLASGAVIPANSQFLAVLGDQRNGRNLEAPEALIRQIVREESRSESADITVRFEGTMGELIRVLKPYITRENVRKGTNLVQGGAAS